MQAYAFYIYIKLFCRYVKVLKYLIVLQKERPNSLIFIYKYVFTYLSK